MIACANWRSVLTRPLMPKVVRYPGRVERLARRDRRLGAPTSLVGSVIDRAHDRPTLGVGKCACGGFLLPGKGSTLAFWTSGWRWLGRPAFSGQLNWC